MAHSDFERLIDFTVAAAQTLLEHQGEFLPTAASVSADGHLSPATTVLGDHAGDADARIDGLYRQFASLAVRSRIVAFAIAYDTRFSPTGERQHLTDAIAVAMEQENGESYIFYVPYERLASGQFVYDEPLLEVNPPRVFARSPAA